MFILNELHHEEEKKEEEEDLICEEYKDRMDILWTVCNRLKCVFNLDLDYIYKHKKSNYSHPTIINFYFRCNKASYTFSQYLMFRKLF